MSTNRLPQDYRDNSDHSYFNDVQYFSDRLINLQESLLMLAGNAEQIEPGMSEGEKETMVTSYKSLASFTGHLAYMAQKQEAEVSEESAVFRHHASYIPLNPILKKQLADGMDKLLLEEVGQDYYDKDMASFSKQINVFITKLRNHYQLGPRQR